MKKYLCTLVTVAALVVAIIAQFRISALQDEIRRLRNDLNNSLSRMQSDQNSTLSYMQQMMEKEASILTDTQFSLGGLNVADRTFVLTGSVTPKEHQPDVTQAFLTVNGKEYPMTLANGAYTAELTLPLFEETTVSQVSFREGETVRTETLDQFWLPREELLPYVSARFSGNGRGNAANGVYTWYRDGEVQISVEGKGQTVEVRSISLIEELDGVEVARTEIPLTNTQSNRGDKTAPEPAPETGSQVSGSETFYQEINRDFEIPFGSTLELVAEVVDGNGLRYRSIVERWSISESGEYLDDNLWDLRDLLEKILDAEGNVLYEVDESEYR